MHSIDLGTMRLLLLFGASCVANAQIEFKGYMETSPSTVVLTEGRNNHASFNVICGVSVNNAFPRVIDVFTHDGNTVYNGSRQTWDSSQVGANVTYSKSSHSLMMTFTDELNMTFTDVDILYYDHLRPYMFRCEVRVSDGHSTEKTKNMTTSLLVVGSVTTLTPVVTFPFHNVTVTCSVYSTCGYEARVEFLRLEGGVPLQLHSDNHVAMQPACDSYTNYSHTYNAIFDDATSGKVQFRCRVTVGDTSALSKIHILTIVPTLDTDCNDTTSCTRPELCIRRSSCTDKPGKCTCPHKYFNQAMTCVPKKPLGSACTNAGQCETLFAGCVKPEIGRVHICACPAGWVYDADWQTCSNAVPCPNKPEFIYNREASVCYNFQEVTQYNVTSLSSVWNACKDDNATSLNNVTMQRHFLQRVWKTGTFSRALTDNVIKITNLTFDRPSILLSAHQQATGNWLWPSSSITIEISNSIYSPSYCGLFLDYVSDDVTNGLQFRQEKECSFTVYISCSIRLNRTFCPHETDGFGLVWNVVDGGTRLEHDCPTGYAGSVTRICMYGGEWEKPFYNCTLEILTEILEKLRKGHLTAAETFTALNLNVTASKSTLFLGDLTKMDDILGESMRKSDNTTFNPEIIDDFLETASFLIDDNTHGEQWQKLVETKETGAETLLRTVDVFGGQLSKSLAFVNVTEYSVAKPNILLSYTVLQDKHTDTNILFPNQPELEVNVGMAANWSVNDMTTAKLEPTSIKGHNVTKFVGAVFRNLTRSVPVRLDQLETNVTMVSQVLSLQLIPRAPNPLVPEITLTFRLFQSADDLTRHCSFWNNESWSTEGCREVFANATHVQCACNHLTNFAMLMSPFVPTDPLVTKVAVYITYIGCSLSIVALLITLIIYIKYWKVVRSDRCILVMSLCVAILLANILFLAGADRVHHEYVCTGIAVVLHYAFLAVFFNMFASAIHMFITVTFVFTKQDSHTHKLLGVAYGVPAVIVIITCAVTRFEGYGSKAACWLTIDSGTFWAFAGPAAFVILVDTIVIVILIIKMRGTKSSMDKSAVDKYKMTLRALSVLLPVMGSTWVVGLLAVNKESQWLQVVFAALNTSQGVFIFIFHCFLNKNLRKAMNVTSERKRTEDIFTQELKDRIAAKVAERSNAFSSDDTSETHSTELKKKKNKATEKDKGKGKGNKETSSVNESSLMDKETSQSHVGSEAPVDEHARVPNRHHDNTAFDNISKYVKAFWERRTSHSEHFRPARERLERKLSRSFLGPSQSSDDKVILLNYGVIGSNTASADGGPLDEETTKTQEVKPTVDAMHGADDYANLASKAKASDNVKQKPDLIGTMSLEKGIQEKMKDTGNA